VANFAAHKHVRSEKDIFSIEAMIENNVLRARRLLDLLVACPPQHFFCVSTDKAANPVNIMGASKKLMEEMIMAYADCLPIKTARFANVAFSNGSLPLGFLDRLFKHQPWSCPLGIRRFFVSPIESGELCLMASIMGESGDIVFPKLDEDRDMIPFEQVAKDLLRALGMEPDACATEAEAREKMSRLVGKGAVFHGGLELTVDGGRKTDDREGYAEQTNSPFPKWPVYFFKSDTSGEKTFEEFYTPGEALDMDRFVNLGVVKNAKRRGMEEIDEIFEAMKALFEAKNVTKANVAGVLKDYLPSFEHLETGRGLDQKM